MEAHDAYYGHMATSGPPAYAWDWFARQPLLWRESRSCLARTPAPAASRYAAVETRGEVVTLLRADYPRDALVRTVVDEVVAAVAFLGRVDASFDSLHGGTAPRGMRWWWTTLTGEEVGAPRPSASAEAAVPPPQLSLDEVMQGYGD